MKTLEMPYSGQIVRTKKQSKAFINGVLFPAADIIGNCSFKKSGLRHVTREQTISCSDDPSDWTEIGFRAVRMEPIDNPKLIQFIIWVHNATDTNQIPIPESALVPSLEDREKYMGAVLLSDDQEMDTEDDDEDEECGFENVVIEQKDFFIDNGSYRPVIELEYAFARDGAVIWEESTTSAVNYDWRGDNYQEQMNLIKLENSLRNEFDAIDLTLIGGVLGRLGLLGA